MKDDEQSAETQMEGISSAHSWIKSNTMLRPTKLGKKKGGGGKKVFTVKTWMTLLINPKVVMMLLTKMTTRQTS